MRRSRELLLAGLLVMVGSAWAAPPTVKELEARCEAAREVRLKPLREAEIGKCIAEARNDADFCRRFFADYGNGGKSGGKVRVRLYDDLPDCLAAEEARRTDSSR